MSVQLNIFAYFAIIVNTPKIAFNLTMTHEFCSIFIRNTVKKTISNTYGQARRNSTCQVKEWVSAKRMLKGRKHFSQSV